MRTRIELAQKALQEAEYILIGGGAGLSTAAGLLYSGEPFQRVFTEFVRRYGFTDLYTSAFYPFRTPEELWAYWALHICYARFDPPALLLYQKIFELVGAKPHFVLTTNVDGQFAKAGFAPERIFEVQGDYAYLQCARRCHEGRYYNEPVVREIVAHTHDCRTRPELVPHCPVCGGEMAVSVRKDQYFVEDERWQQAADAYHLFLAEAVKHRLVLLEFGVGYNTPTIIRFPFERIARQVTSATLLRFNKEYPEADTELAHFVGMPEPINEVVTALLAGR